MSWNLKDMQIPLWTANQEGILADSHYHDFQKEKPKQKVSLVAYEEACFGGKIIQKGIRG